MPAPAMPSRGIGPKPKISERRHRDHTMRADQRHQRRHLDVAGPRKAAACKFTIQTGIAPANR